MQNKKIVRTLFEKTFESDDFNEKALESLVSPDYVQHVDGKTLGYKEFVAHVKWLKAKISKINIDFMALIEEGDTVFSNHIVMKDGSTGKAHVIAEFRVRDGKIFYCDELTCLLEGNEKNRHLGLDTEV